MKVRRILVVGDHPGLDRGFATVGRHVAGALHRSGQWDVHYLGRFFDGDAARAPFPYPVYAVPLAGADGDGGLGQRTFAVVAGRLLRDLPAGQASLLVLMLGAADHQSPLVRAALEAGVRHRLHFAAYLAVDYVPLPAGRARLFHAMDTVIPYSAAGRRAITACCLDAGIPYERPLAAVAHGVDTSVFRPLGPAGRAAARARYYGATGDDLVVGFFGRNSRHKRADLALAIFRIFAQGQYATCRACGATSTFVLDPTTYRYASIDACRHCGSSAVERGRARPQARLYLHAELLEPADQMLSGGWDLPELIRRMGLGDQVVVNPGLRVGRGVPEAELAARMAACDVHLLPYEGGGWDLPELIRRMGLGDQVVVNPALRVGRGVPEAELAARMAACDVHLLPYEGGGWELTVLETGACGVPNVITDYSTPPDYAAPFAECVPVGAYQARRRGELVAVIDEERAVAALARLADSPDRRAALGRAGVSVGEAHSWARLSREWLGLLGSIDLSRQVHRPGLAGLAPLLARRPPVWSG